jgi:serine/threonine-protein kinase
MVGLSTFGLLAGLLTIAAAVIRLTRGAGPTSNVTGSEALLLGLMMTLAMATPVGFGLHWLRKNVWNNSAKTLELAGSMSRTVVAVFVTYGVVSLTIRLTEAIFLRRAAGIAWPVWDVLAFGVAFVAGVVAYTGTRRS